MPFQSEAQRRLLWAKRPDIARRWAHEFPGQRNLPHYKRRRANARKRHKRGMRRTARARRR